jgi:hypothetical protein
MALDHMPARPRARSARHLLAVWIVGKAGSYELFHPSRSTIRRTGRLLTGSADRGCIGFGVGLGGKHRVRR